MSDDWIKFRKKLAKDGRVLTVSRKCRALRATVLGALVALWSLADDFCTEDGHLPGYTPDDIDKEVEVPGFCAALPADWMEIRDGLIYLPDYLDHNGETAKKRAQNTSRQRRARVAHMSRSERDNSATREEKNREEERREETTPQRGGAAQESSPPPTIAICPRKDFSGSVEELAQKYAFAFTGHHADRERDPVYVAQQFGEWIRAGTCTLDQLAERVFDEKRDHSQKIFRFKDDSFPRKPASRVTGNGRTGQSKRFTAS